MLSPFLANRNADLPGHPTRQAARADYACYTDVDHDSGHHFASFLLKADDPATYFNNAGVARYGYDQDTCSPQEPVNRPEHRPALDPVRRINRGVQAFARSFTALDRTGDSIPASFSSTPAASPLSAKALRALSVI